MNYVRGLIKLKKICEYQNECEEILKDGSSRMYSFRTTGAPAKYQITFKQYDTIKNETSEHTYITCRSCMTDLLTTCENSTPKDDYYFRMLHIADYKTKKSMPTNLDYWIDF